MTGHLLGAAGAIEGIATLLAVKNDVVPPTINHFTDDDAIDIDEPAVNGSMVVSKNISWRYICWSKEYIVQF